MKLLKVKLSLGPSVDLLVGLSVIILSKGREVTLPWQYQMYQTTCFKKDSLGSAISLIPFFLQILTIWENVKDLKSYTINGF